MVSFLYKKEGRLKINKLGTKNIEKIICPVILGGFS